ncbi:hypothetical protein E2320_022723 [Naja naja]|nr:hypothetical protein E2320_022723 [Naja naja]
MDLHSANARELADVGMFIEALRTRFEDGSRAQQVEGELLSLKQQGRPAKDYIHDFRWVAGKLWLCLEHLLIHQFRAGLEQDLRQACVFRGLPNWLQAWFRADIELDAGLQEFRPRADGGPGTRKTVDRISPTAGTKARLSTLGPKE